MLSASRTPFSRYGFDACSSSCRAPRIQLEYVYAVYPRDVQLAKRKTTQGAILLELKHIPVRGATHHSMRTSDEDSKEGRKELRELEVRRRGMAS